MEKTIRKLGYKGETPVLIINAPETFKAEAFPIFAGKVVEKVLPPGEPASFPFVMLFARNLAEVSAMKASAVTASAADGKLYICYPKKSSKNYQSDLSRDIVWPLLGEFGYEPVSLFSLDEDWSAMRFKKAEAIKSLKRTVASTETGRQRIEAMNAAKSEAELEQDQRKSSGIYGKIKPPSEPLQSLEADKPADQVKADKKVKPRKD